MNLKYLLNSILFCSVSLAPCLMLAADPQGSPSVRPPFLIRADQDQIDDRVQVHSQDNAVPTAADFTAGLLTSGQTGLIARPAIEMVKAVAVGKPGDYTVDLRIEALMPFGESNADLLYKGTTIGLLRFSRPGVAVGPADGTTIIARQPNPLLLVLDNHSAFTYKDVAARLRFQDHDFCTFEVGSPQATPVWSKYSCSPLVVLEQPAEPVTTFNRAIRICFLASLRKEQLVVFPLMVSFVVVVSPVLGQNSQKWTLAEQDYLRQALLLDRTNPPFGKRIQIWASGWKRQGLHASRCQH